MSRFGACSARISGDTHTHRHTHRHTHTQTHRTTTVTLAAHARRGLTTSALPKTKPLALLLERELTAPRVTATKREAWPISTHAHWHNYKCTRRDAMRRGFCTLVLFINPRRACAARVTVLLLCVCLSVCLSVCLWSFQLTLRWLFRS